MAGFVTSRLEKPPALTVLFGVTSILPFVATRHTPLAVVGAVVLAGHHMGDALARLSGEHEESGAFRGGPRAARSHAWPWSG